SRVADQAASLHEFRPFIHRRNCVARGERNETIARDLKERVGHHQESTSPALDESHKGRLDFAVSAGIQDKDLLSKRAASFLNLRYLHFSNLAGRVHEKGDCSGLGNQLAQKLETFRAKRRHKRMDASRVPARPIEAIDEPIPDRIAPARENERDGVGQPPNCPERLGSACGHDQFHAASDQINCQCRQPVVLAFRPAIFDPQIAADEKASFAQSLAERGQQNILLKVSRSRTEITDGPWRRLLRARRERPRGRAAEQDDELSPPHVSRATVWRSLSGWLAALSGYHGGVSQVLGADLKCSESRRTAF